MLKITLREELFVAKLKEASKTFF